VIGRIDGVFDDILGFEHRGTADIGVCRQVLGLWPMQGLRWRSGV